MNSPKRTIRYAAIALVTGSLFWSSASFAHCDSLDGPVISDARTALTNQNLTPVLKWVAAGDEKEIRAAFQDTVNVRKLGGTAENLADRYFFETLVRLHRANEGAPYTGLKPAGSASKAAQAADRALEKGEVDALAEKLGDKVRDFVRDQFKVTVAGKDSASTPEGRQFVADYVRYVHSVEAIHNIVAGEHDAH